MKGCAMAQRVEAKVTAGSLSAAVAGAGLWALQTYVFHGGAVPDGLVSLIYLAAPAVLAAAAGYLAPHTNRPALAPAIVTQTASSTSAPGPMPGLDTPPEYPPPPTPAEPQPPGATEPPSPEAAV